MAAMRGLVERPEGLVLADELLSVDEEAAVVARLDAFDYAEIRLRGQVARRTSRHFGYVYDYTARDVAPTDPWPQDLDWLRDRCAGLADVPADVLVEALVNRYPPGAAIGWHRDAPMFGAPLVGVSLLAPCALRFQRRVQDDARRVFEQRLEPRSAYVLRGAARWTWQHSIPPVAALRYSITFRTLRS